MAARLVPTLRYRDIAAAADWLCSTFGFKRIRVFTGVDGSIQQAQLAFGNDIIMLLPARDFSPDAPAPDLAVAELQSCYFVVDDADTHHHNAKAAGAEILDIRQYDLGGRGFIYSAIRRGMSGASAPSIQDNNGSRSPSNDRPSPRRHQYDPWAAARGRRRPGLAHSIADAAVGVCAPGSRWPA